MASFTVRHDGVRKSANQYRRLRKFPCLVFGVPVHVKEFEKTMQEVSHVPNHCEVEETEEFGSWPLQSH